MAVVFTTIVSYLVATLHYILHVCHTLAPLAHFSYSTLAPGGYLFFRESCYYPSGHCHVSEDDDPSRYRSPKASHVYSYGTLSVYLAAGLS